MNRHRGGIRELTWDMERALACAVIASGSAIEASMRRHQHHAQLMALDAAPSALRDAADVAALNYERVAERAAHVRDHARRSLAFERPDAEFWLTASTEELADRLRSDGDTDPEMVGDRAHDRRWASHADAAELMDVLACAEKWQPTSIAAEMLVAHIAELLRARGVDVDRVTTLSRSDAIAQVVSARSSVRPRPIPVATGRELTVHPADDHYRTVARTEFDLDDTPPETTERRL